jgi:hypothetical protein
MSVLEKLRIGPELDPESGVEFDPESRQESGEEFDYESNPNLDPPPGASTSRTSGGKSAPKIARTASETGPRITKKMRDEAQEEIQSIVEVLALAWGWQAPPCGEALEQAAPEFAAKLTKIVARNPRWLQRVREGGVIADILACAGTLAPVAAAARQFYFSRPEGGDYRGPGVEFDPSRFQPYDGSGMA